MFNQSMKCTNVTKNSNNASARFTLEKENPQTPSVIVQISFADPSAADGFKINGLYDLAATASAPATEQG